MRYFTRTLMIVACAVADAAAQEAAFTRLGLLPGGGTLGSWATVISDDGQVVAGTATIEDPLDILPFIWTESLGMKEIEGRPPGVHHTSVIEGISADGSFIAGTFVFDDWRSQAFLWERDVGFTLLPYLPGEDTRSSASGIGRDGTRIFGSSSATGPEAVIWDYPFDAPRGLGDLPGGPSFSVIRSATPDGLAACGRSSSARGTEAVLWREGRGFVALGDLPGGAFESTARGLSLNGRVVVGYGNTAGGNAGAFRWTEAGGMVSLGTLPGDAASGASATIADGSVVLGNSNRLSGGDIILNAFIWDRVHGMRNLTTVLEDEYGLDLGGWELARATDTTPDGRFIVGQARSPTGVLEAYRVQIPPFCYADCDDSSGRGVLDFFDFLEFQRRFALRDAYSDCDENGVHDFFDFLCFQNHFAAGCP